MSWEIFKQNILRVANNPDSISSLEQVAELYALEYDACIKRGGDTVNRIPIKQGNVEMMKQLFIAAFQKGLTSTQPYDLVGEMGKGVIAYWSGATMQNIPVPVIPAPGTIANIAVTQNIVTNPGQWVGGSTAVAQKVKEAEEEKESPTEEDSAGPKELDTLGENEVISANEVDSTIVSSEEIGYEDEDISGDVVLEKDNIERRSLKRSAVNKYGGGSGSGGGDVDINDIDLNANWVDAAAKYIASKEGFLACADNDEGTLRLGYGTDKILQANGSIRKVQAGDCTDRDSALKVLKYEVAKPYLLRLIGTGERKISMATFEGLSTGQKVACLSMVYNCGSLTKSVAAAIRGGDRDLAVQAFKNGPTKGAQSGKVYPGLVTRRNEEAALFSKV